MKTGFFIEREDLAKELNRPEGYDAVDFGFMENELCDTYTNVEQAETDNLYGFLHGYCYVFADILSKMLPGSKVEYLYDGRELIHAYVVLNNVYIDVRGINSDWDEFIEEFDDWIPCHERYELEIKNNLKENYPYDKNLDKVIEDIIKGLPNYYGLQNTRVA